MPRELNKAGLELIKSFEGIMDGNPSTVNLDPYLDPVGIWTIGWGHAITYGISFLRGKKGKQIARSLYPGGITLAQAEEMLRQDVFEVTLEVLYLVKVPITDNQFAALVSFTFNLGAGGLERSTLLRLVNQGKFQAASAEFRKWNKARNPKGVLVRLGGLSRRRAAEMALFLKP